VIRTRGTLAQRIALLAIAVAVMTGLVAGILTLGLVRKANEHSAQQTLSRLADAAQATSEVGVNEQAGQVRARQTLRALRVEFASISREGSVSGNSPLARNALSAQEIATVLAGTSLSKRRSVAGQVALVEARGTRGGAIVLVQRRADALAIGNQAIQRMLWALLIAVGIAVLLGLVVATRLARPLRHTAQAARELASGRRDVVVHTAGPREVAEVALAVNGLSAALSHSEARQRDFLLSVSHDLRTPLTAIAGFAESLADGMVEPAQTAQVGAVMLTEAQRLNRLVADLLDLARLDAQEFRIDLAPVDLAQVARVAAQVWQPRCEAAGVRFVLEIPGGAALAHTDANRVRQALDGLLENALRVTPAGAPIVLSVRAADAGSGQPSVIAEVRDGGPGLTEADLAVAFDRSALYERYRGVRQVGTGLGLAIVHGLVTRLGGAVEAGHAPEGGARFTVWLPAASVAPTF
jgi:two-component system OmpR family sensor kinase